MESLRQQLTTRLAEEERNVLRRPQIAVVGFDDYVKLKFEVMSSIAETFPHVPMQDFSLHGAFRDCTTGPQPEPYNLLFPFTRMGIECFAWNGILVCESKSVSTGTFFL